ncbi:MAG: VWA domain-containing protein, partial [Gemmatimonadota bacterium]
LYLAPVMALLLGLIAWQARRRRVRAATAWSQALGAAAAKRGALGPIAFTLIGLAAAAGLAGPRWGETNVSSETRSLSLVIAIDISRSMLAEDVLPNRLQRAIQEARRLLQDARGDRLALLAFAGRSYILTPLTLDQGAVALQLDALDPDIASEGGTDLATVLHQGGELLSVSTDGGARALVVFTDGESHDSIQLATQAARELKDAGVTTIFVAEGGIRPARIPIRDSAGRLIEYKKQADGSEVATSRHDEILRTVTDAAEGILIPADFPDQAGAVWKTVAGLDRAAATGSRVEDFIPRAWIFALVAGVLLILHAMTRRTAALVAILLAVGLGTARAQRPSVGERQLHQGDSTGALAAFLRAAKRETIPDTAWYNAGTLALSQGKYEDARQALGVLSQSLDPELRFRALYNSGIAALKLARQDTAQRSQLEAEAAQRFQDALLLEPRSAATKWNLELLHQAPPPPKGGGGPKNDPKPHGGGGAPNQAPPPSGGQQMNQSQAEQILNSVERNERAVRADQLKRRRTAKSAIDKDW